jgi:2-polyprenyl-6-methoxyphenol hydroxylase-like FAD-dependent oxidoreductase
VRRSDLLDRLGEGLPEGTVRWNTAVTSLTQADGGVEVGFADGTKSGWDLVVGADGVRSAVRSAAFGAATTRAALLSAASWRFMAPDPGVDRWVVWISAHATLLLIPVDRNEVYGYASATRGGPVDADPEWLRSTFGGFPDPVPSVVKAVLEQPGSLYHSPVEEVRIPEWSRGRTVLIGDAAHATAPVWAQGAALAVEDALVLADLLATRSDWSAVGAEFERVRRPRVAHVQAMTDRMSRAARVPLWIRDRILPRLGPRTYRETFEPLKVPVTGG